MCIKQHILSETRKIIHPKSFPYTRHIALVHLLCGHLYKDEQKKPNFFTYGAIDILIFPALYHFCANLLLSTDFKNYRNSDLSFKCVYYLVLGIYRVLGIAQVLLIAAISTVIVPLTVFIDLLLSRNYLIDDHIFFLIKHNPFKIISYWIERCIQMKNPLFLYHLIPHLFLYTLEVIILPLRVVRNIFIDEPELDLYARIRELKDMIFGTQCSAQWEKGRENFALGLFDGFPLPVLLRLPSLARTTAADENEYFVKRIIAGILGVLLSPLDALWLVLCTATFVALLPLVLLTHGTQKIASAVSSLFHTQKEASRQPLCAPPLVA